MNSGKTISEMLDYGLCLHQEDKLELAGAVYRKVLELSPEQPEALHYLGLLLAQQGQMATAVEVLQRALKAKPESAICYRDLAMLLHELDRYDEAELAFHKAIKLQPHFPEALCSLGDLYRHMCSLDDAVACYEKAAAQKSDLTDALRRAESTRLSMERVRAFAGSIRSSEGGGEVQGSLNDTSNLRLERREFLPHLLNLVGLCGVGAEIGVKEGKFSERILRHWEGTLLYSVDPWREFPAPDYQDVCNVSQAEQDELYRQTIRRLMRFERRSVIWRLTSKEAAELIPDGSLDFCYIDGDHSYRGVSEDLRIWHPKVRRGGLLGGHDFIADGDYWFGKFGVHRAVTEFVATWNSKIFISGESPGESPSWFILKE